MMHTFVALLGAAPLVAGIAFQSTPLMGWNSWNTMACSPDHDKISKTINSLADRGFVDAGYNFFQIDCGWASRDLQRNGTTGALNINFKAFPQGLKPLSDLARSKGMKWSMYSNAGLRMCDPEYPNPVLGSLGHERADAELFKSLNTEYVKYDNCFIDGTEQWKSAPKDPRTDWESRFGAMWKELQRVGIPGFLICQWGVPFQTSKGLKGPASWTQGISTSFRISDDIGEGWDDIYRIYNQAIHIVKADVVGPGNIADADLLEVGNPGMTIDQQATHFAAWAMLKSPLFISTNVAALSNELVDILQNGDLISINQDPAVKPVKLVQRWTGDRDLWVGDLSGGDLAVLVVNLSPEPKTLSLDLSNIGVDNAVIKNLWSGEVKENAKSYSQQVNSYGSMALRLLRVNRSSPRAVKYNYITATDGAMSSGAKPIACWDCSSPNKAAYIGGPSRGTVVYSNIRTSKSTQNVLFDYINAEIGYKGFGKNERLASISVNGGPEKTVSFPFSGYTWEADVSKDYVVELSGFDVNGPNSIKISGVQTGWAPDFIRIGLLA